MPSERLLIVGSSGHAKVVVDLAERSTTYEIVGLIDPFRHVGDEVLGYRVLGGEDDIPVLIDRLHISACFVAIGDNFVRAQVVERIQSKSSAIRFATLIHPAAYIARDVRVGIGSAVMAGVVVNPCCDIGDFCILNTRSSLDHDGILESFSSIAPGATLGGNVRVGRGSAIGIGATIVQKIVIGEHSVVGAGATVLRDVDSFRVVYGVPARAIRDREAGDRYL